MRVLPFLANLSFAVIVAILTGSSQAMRAALVNPVDSLRSE
jgi:hypothetical protein